MDYLSFKCQIDKVMLGAYDGARCERSDSSEDVQGRLVALYRCHAAEWRPFSEAVQRSAGKRCA